MMEQEGNQTLLVLSSYPRRLSRLFGYLFVMIAGLLFAIQPAITTTSYISSYVPILMWGVLLVIGGGVCTWSWFVKVLIIDRIGLSIMATALVGMVLNQAVIFYETWSANSAANMFLLAFILMSLVSRWLDVKHDEKANRAALNNMSG